MKKLSLGLLVPTELKEIMSEAKKQINNTEDFILSYQLCNFDEFKTLKNFQHSFYGGSKKLVEIGNLLLEELPDFIGGYAISTIINSAYQEHTIINIEIRVNSFGAYTLIINMPPPEEMNYEL